jgi:hypothetical protein
VPFQKLSFRPGITHDLTSLANEGGWYACDKVRFRLGFPEKIGGWVRTSANVFLGVARSLSSWYALAGVALAGVGTHLKMYVTMGGAYYDITPLRQTTNVAANAFTTVNLSAVVTCNVTGHGAAVGDYVTLSTSLSAVGGIPAANFVGEFTVLGVTDADHFTITVASTATSNATGGNSLFEFQLPVGAAVPTASYGWGSGAWGSGSWGLSSGSTPIRVWNQVPYGELLVFGQRGGPLYLFTPTVLSYGFDRGVAVSSLPGASSVPLFQNAMAFSPSARILVLFGTNSYTGSGSLDPMLVRWADSDSLVEWAPAATNLSGEYRLPVGSKIMATANARQDTLILTDSAVYLMQFIGAPYVFGFTQQADNVSIISEMAMTSAAGVVYWMGVDKFYVYDGAVRTLECTIKKLIFPLLNADQVSQTFAGTCERFNEIWWFFCTTGNAMPDSYAVYNYEQKIWYYGTMARTAWLDTPITFGPLAATAFNNLVVHETGIDDLSTASSQAIEASIQSSDFDIGDGQSYAFVRAMLPDVNFAGSTATNPVVYMSVQGRQNPGGNVNQTPQLSVTLTESTPVSKWTDKLSLRIRARQMNVTMQSVDVGVQWQFGAPRIDVRPDGRTS